MIINFVNFMVIYCHFCMKKGYLPASVLLTRGILFSLDAPSKVFSLNFFSRDAPSKVFSPIFFCRDAISNVFNPTFFCQDAISNVFSLSFFCQDAISNVFSPIFFYPTSSPNITIDLFFNFSALSHHFNLGLPNALMTKKIGTLCLLQRMITKFMG